MEKPFCQSISLASATENEVIAFAAIPAESPWYDGHFPGHPILPGIAILGLVAEAIHAQAHHGGRAVTLTGLSRVRFRLPVSPGERMEIRLRREKRAEEWVYSFSVILAGESLCGGVFTGREQAEKKSLTKGI
ncbi:MAG: hypothetical protein FWE89_00425 [Syntrophaceae bacterium]|nr:hypothetical protein [Syntrophaceae bacterium]